MDHRDSTKCKDGDEAETRKSTGLSRREILKFGALGALASVGIGAGTRNASAQSAPIRIAWQPQWAGTAYNVFALKNTDILQKYGLSVQWVPFIAGGPAIAAMLSGDIDAAYIGDAPAVILLSRTNSVKIVAHLIDHHAALFTKAGAPYRTLTDLKGKTVATFFGAGVHIQLVRWFHEFGMRPGEDYKLLNLGLAEGLQALLKNEIDAAMIWGSAAQEARNRGELVIVREAPEPCPVVMKADLITKRREDAVKFMAAYQEATLFCALQRELVNRWAGSHVGLKDPRPFEFDVELDRNRNARSMNDIRIEITNGDVAWYDAIASFLFESKAIPKKPDIKEAHDGSLVRDSVRYINRAKYNPKVVRITAAS